MKHFFVVALILTLKMSYSQERVELYHSKSDKFTYLLLLGCEVGYTYTGPHLFVDEIFSYEKVGDRIIRTFDSSYSLKGRIDTLILKNEKRLFDHDGMIFKKVSPKRKNELIKKYIHPVADAGFYWSFLEMLKGCS